MKAFQRFSLLFKFNFQNWFRFVISYWIGPFCQNLGFPAMTRGRHTLIQLVTMLFVEQPWLQPVKRFWRTTITLSISHNALATWSLHTRSRKWNPIFGERVQIQRIPGEQSDRRTDEQRLDNLDPDSVSVLTWEDARLNWAFLLYQKTCKKNSLCYLLFRSILGKIIWISRWSVAVGWYNGSNTSPCSSLLCELEGNGSNELLQEQLPDRKYTLLPIIFIKLHYFNWRMGEISIKSSDLFGHTQGSNEVFILIQFYKVKINW